MSDGQDGGFIGRWSRRKREARVQRETVARESEAAEGQEAGQEPEEFDVSTLPPLDALDAASDYTAFMQKGVPKALRLAALRKAWVTDPAITGYKTLADYDWDFNAPGYGKLLPTDDPKKLVDALFRHLQQREGEAEAETGEVAEAPAEPVLVPVPVQIEASVPEPAESVPPEPVGVVEPEPVPVRRRHGGAVPT